MEWLPSAREAGQVAKQLGGFQEQRRVAVAASLLRDGPRQPGFADSGGTDQKQILMSLDPGRLLRQRTHDGAVQAAWRAIVDVFDAGRSLQSRVAQTALQRAVLAPVPLTVDEQAEPFFEAELVDVGLLHLLLQGLGHAAHAHGAEFVECGLIQHDGSLLYGWRIEVLRPADVGVIERRPGRLGRGLRQRVQIVASASIRRFCRSRCGAAAPAARRLPPAGLPYSSPSRMMPRHERYPCSGCGLEARMRSSSSAVSGPMVRPHSTIREGVHCRYRWCDFGRCSSAVVALFGARLRAWLATRTPLWKISTVEADERTSTGS